jgi:hypothetical protein
VSTFEKPLEIDTPPGIPQNLGTQRSLYQQSVPLSPGRYGLNILARDAASGKLNKYDVALNARGFDENTLASSSLILADTIEAAPAGTIRMPRQQASFTVSAE